MCGIEERRNSDDDAMENDSSSIAVSGDGKGT